MHTQFTYEERIAFFSMEIAFDNDIPTYSGGLGVLAGDALLAAADMGIPLVGVTLVSREGYFRQLIDAEGRQMEMPDPWDPAGRAQALNATVAVEIGGREVWVRGWLEVVKGRAGDGIPVILLDTDLGQNHVDDRLITHHLYGDGDDYRIKQEIVLGIGGVRLLHALGFRIRKYHMNEGHSAFLTIELLNRFRYAATDVHPDESPYDAPRVRQLCNFTTHTPVEAGHDKFSYELVQQTLTDGIDMVWLRHFAGADVLNMTQLALNLSQYVNGVAKRHATLSKTLFPGHAVQAITNGVHAYRWTAPALAQLYNEYVPGWDYEPELLVRADRIPDALIARAHQQCRRDLIEQIRAATSIQFKPDIPVIGFARRMTGYKRPGLLFSDLERLRRIAQRWPFQIVLAGKAHPKDGQGKYLIETLHRHMRELRDVIPIAFLPDYDLDMARAMVAGADVWLNTPQRPLEASGTSGMKAACNGVPQLSVLDGWWIEGCIEGVTGWAIGDDAETSNGGDMQSLYDKLEFTVLPLWHEAAGQSPGWVSVMKGAISKSASYFNSHRMMRRYTTEVYVR
ncbi:MAG: alpha-glucan family phosphorylase [Steroidobacteraceae bacterium]